MKVLIIGKTGQLARELADLDWPPSFQVRQTDRGDCDLAEPRSIRRALLTARPDLVVNAAACTAVDRAEAEPELAMRINGEGPAALARICAETGAALVHISTDYVFDGNKTAAYLEGDAVNPLSVYGRTKLAGERAIRESLARHVIIRTSWVFSSHGNNFVKTMLRLGAQGREIRVVADQTGAPTSARDLARAILTIATAISAQRGVWGTFHYASAEPTSWFAFAQTIFAESGDRLPVTVTPISSADYGGAAPRPMNSVLDCPRIRDAYGIDRPSWREALTEALAEIASPESRP
ncbi:MAG TPA: dTDP-4-dehydrorhamnose reductase [Rhizomicrobium sp.]